MKAVVFASIALASLTGCDRLLTRPSLYNTVKVVAIRRNGDPVPGVGLTLYTGQRPMGYAMTGRDGSFTFTTVPQGNYGVAATVPDGYDVIEHLISAPSSTVRDGLVVANDTLSTVRFTFLKKGPGTITVRVAQLDGTPLSGIPVGLYDPAKLDATATTDSAGRATFNLVPFGAHGVSILRPLFYRDYRVPSDSLTSFRDNVIVEDGSRDTVVFTLAKCAGTLGALAIDQFGSPVANVATDFYTSTALLKTGKTGVDGQIVYGPVPCAVQFGVRINPPAGYSVAEGRGSSFIDGITLTNGATVTATFHVQRAP